MEKWQESSGKYALCLCITVLLQTAIRQEEVLHNKTQNELTQPLRNVLLYPTFSSLLHEIFILRYSYFRRLPRIDIDCTLYTQTEYASNTKNFKIILFSVYFQRKEFTHLAPCPEVLQLNRLHVLSFRSRGHPRKSRVSVFQ